MLAPRPAPRSNVELWAALFAVLAISLVYGLVVYAWQEIPAASDLFGHSIGIFGFTLMVMTEVLYSLRKRSLSSRWGRLSTWLRFHIFTGLVGPFMVLLHSAWKLNGLAAVALLFTVIIVISGFIGRYIYTAIPRTADGVELEAEAVRQHIAEIDAELRRQAVPGGQLSHNLERLRRRQDALRRQIAALARSRRMLSVWHTIHVPIGIVLFTAAVIHIVAAFYYATLPRLLGGG